MAPIDNTQREFPGGTPFAFYMPIREAASLLNSTPSNIHKSIKSGKLTSILIDKERFVSRKDVEALQRQQDFKYRLSAQSPHWQTIIYSTVRAVSSYFGIDPDLFQYPWLAATQDKLNALLWVFRRLRIPPEAIAEALHAPKSSIKIMQGKIPSYPDWEGAMFSIADAREEVLIALFAEDRIRESLLSSGGPFPALLHYLTCRILHRPHIPGICSCAEGIYQIAHDPQAYDRVVQALHDAHLPEHLYTITKDIERSR